jgi:hypothetical protein
MPVNVCIGKDLPKGSFARFQSHDPVALNSYDSCSIIRNVETTLIHYLVAKSSSCLVITVKEV